MSRSRDLVQFFGYNGNIINDMQSFLTEVRKKVALRILSGIFLCNFVLGKLFCLGVRKAVRVDALSI